MRNKIILYLLMWHINCLRVHIRTSQHNELAIQVWAHQKITDKQWKKLDLLIKIMGKTVFYYDIITFLQGSQRYFKEIKNPRNSLLMRRDYEEHRKRMKV